MSVLLKATVVSSVVFVLLGTSLMFLPKTQDYVTLLRVTDLSDAADVTKLLKEQKVPYRLEEGGSTVSVTKDSLYEARLLVASKGLPHSGASGFELFDRANLNLSEFSERVTWLRALQGELARTIQEVDGVEHARVHLSLPQEQVFSDARQTPSASVTLRLARGANMSRENVAAIVALVSRSVPGLDAERVSIVTQHGKVLWDAAPDSKKPKTGNDDATQSYQRSLEERVQSMLSPVVGEGHCQVRVAAVLDFTEQEVQTSRVIPDSAQAKSRQKSDEKYKNGGQPGQPLPRPSGGPIGSSSDYDRQSETVQYEMSTETARQVIPAGRVKGLKVAVLIDEQAVKGNSVVRLESLVADAVGLDRTRGDRLTVQTMAFRDVDEPSSIVPAKAAATSSSASSDAVLVCLVLVGLAVLVLAQVASRRRPPEHDTLPRLDARRTFDPARNAAFVRSLLSREDDFRA